MRTAAFQLLGKHYDGTKDREFGGFLAQLVLSPSQEPSVRLQAYKSLIFLEDLSVEWTPTIHELTFPADIDWEFVRNFVREED